jgi:hypothetical protein
MSAPAEEDGSGQAVPMSLPEARSDASGGEPPAGDSDVDASYADWRTEVVGLASADF